MLCRAIAGFSKWQFPYTLTAERAKEQEQSDKEAIPFPKSVNREMTRDFLHDHMLPKWIDHEQDFCRYSFYVIRAKAAALGRVEYRCSVRRL